jgi:hypothetical protein
MITATIVLGILGGCAVCLILMATFLWMKRQFAPGPDPSIVALIRRMDSLHHENDALRRQLSHALMRAHDADLYEGGRRELN